MLTCDASQAGFILDGTLIDRTATSADLADRLSGTLQHLPGQVGWRAFKTRNGEWNVSISFKDSRIHSGYFWANVSSSGSWDDWEPTEARRRAEHESTMQRLFGAPSFDAGGLKVYLVRDPRDSMERIMFEFS